MKINFDEIEETTGRKFKDLYQFYFYILRSVEFLYSHSKNYNKKQFEKIAEFMNFCLSVKFDD